MSQLYKYSRRRHQLPHRSMPALTADCYLAEYIPDHVRNLIDCFLIHNLRIC